MDGYKKWNENTLQHKNVKGLKRRKRRSSGIYFPFSGFRVNTRLRSDGG